MLRYYRMADQPEKLSDAEWSQRYAILMEIRKDEAKQNGAKVE